MSHTVNTPAVSTGPAESSAGRTPATESADLLAGLRAASPLVQCLTNSVVTNFTANVLLALGASPAMTDIPDEAGPFAAIASGVLINLGTPHREQRLAMLEAAGSARDAGTPWVLDPVAVGALPVRTALARELLRLGPGVIRGNASEIIAVAGAGAGGRGVDSTDTPESAREAAVGLAGDLGCVVAVSGPSDLITDGARTFRVHNGDPLLTRITGGGCALGAVMAAFASLASPEADTLQTVVAATAVYTLAAESAAHDDGGRDGSGSAAAGPGTFAVRFLDALAAVTGEQVAAGARIEAES